jgi:hypothetical protein
LARVSYDALQGYERLTAVAERVDLEAAKILTVHVALEAEMDAVLSKILPRADRMRKIGFPNKVRVLEAAWVGDPEAGDRACAVLARFNDLRNSIAHGDREAQAGCRKSLVSAYQQINNRARDDIDVLEIAQGVCLFLGDGPTVETLERFKESLAEMTAALNAATAGFRNIRIEIPAMPDFSALLTRDK